MFHAKRRLAAALVLTLPAAFTSCQAGMDLIHSQVMRSTTKDLPEPSSLVAPIPRPDGAGEFRSPIDADGRWAGWAEVAIEAGAHHELLGGLIPKNASFADAMVGKAVDGNVMGVNESTVEAAGGWESIVETSTVTFDSEDDLVRFLWIHHGDTTAFTTAFKLSQDLYPDMASRLRPALKSATPKPTKAASLTRQVGALRRR